MTLSTYDPIYFAAARTNICPRHKNHFFLMGPYRISPEQDVGLIYRPMSTIPYLVTLLDHIEKDLFCCRAKKQATRKTSNFYIQKAIKYVQTFHPG